MVVDRFDALIVAVCILLALGPVFAEVSSTGDAQASMSLDRVARWQADGDIRGSCNLIGAVTEEPQDHVITLPGEGLVVTRSAYQNRTALVESIDNGLYLSEDPGGSGGSEQFRTIAPGQIKISLHEGGRIVLLRADDEWPREPATFTAEGSSVSTSSGSGDLRDEHRLMPILGSEQLGRSDRFWSEKLYLPSASRPIDLLNGSANLSGDLHLLVRSATIELADGETVEVAARESIEENVEDEYGAVDREIVRLTDVTLRLPGGSWLAEGPMQFHCGAAEWALEGLWTVRTESIARFAQVTGDTDLPVGVVELAGRFDISEALEPTNPGYALRAESDGEVVRALSNGVPVAVEAPASPSLLVRSFWGIVAGGLFVLVKHGATQLWFLLVRNDRDAVLNQPRREAIMDYVLANHGVTVKDVAEHVGIHLETTRYHLAMLRRHGFVRKIRFGRTTLVCPPAGDVQDVVLDHISADPKLVAVAAGLQAGQARAEMVSNLAGRFDVNERTVRKWISKVEPYAMAAEGQK